MEAVMACWELEQSLPGHLQHRVVKPVPAALKKYLQLPPRLCFAKSKRNIVGSGMPYYVGHETVSMPPEAAVIEQAPAGEVARAAAAVPAKGGIGALYAPNPNNRYYRHVVHCKGCRGVVKRLGVLKNAMGLLTLVDAAAAVLAATSRLKAALLALAAVLLGASQVCSSVVYLIKNNFIRTHRRL